MGHKLTYLIIFFSLSGLMGIGQDLAYDDAQSIGFIKAREEASKDNHGLAKDLLVQVVAEHPDDLDAQSLLARTYSWEGQYDKARETFNTLISQEKNSRAIWISSIKNELYAKNTATALGLSNKALIHFKSDNEIERLREIALQRIGNREYPESGWFNQSTELKVFNTESEVGENDSEVRMTESQLKANNSEVGENHSQVNENDPKLSETEAIVPKTPVDKDVLNNRLAIRNAYTVFDQRYDPIIASSVSYKRQTLAGSIIPRINYNNRRKINGLQYELDFYPKFSKLFYAYLNYGFSKASIYPKHKVGGDLYANLPGAIEFSAGGRYINFETKNVSVITNSLGHYRGNYYFSLRSYITPLPDHLTRISGNLLVRKYMKDAENYMGLNVGMGYSPELRQLTSGDELLAETLLYVESQRLSLEYQFTGKKNPNIYKANMGVTRQELAFDSGNFFWSVSAGFTYQVKF